MSWLGRIWRRVVRRRSPPPPPPPPPPVYYYPPSSGVRPRSAYGGEQPGQGPKTGKRMRFQPPTPETLAQIKEALDEQTYTFKEDLVKGISVSNPDFGSSDSNQRLE